MPVYTNQIMMSSWIGLPIDACKGASSLLRVQVTLPRCNRFWTQGKLDAIKVPFLISRTISSGGHLLQIHINFGIVCRDPVRNHIAKSKYLVGT